MTRDRLARLGGLCGAIGPVVSLGAIVASIALSPWFNWHRDALSDMGVDLAVAPLFNGAMVAGGLFSLAFAAGLHRATKPGLLVSLGALALGIGATGLALVGVFPEDRGRIHFLVAAAYFTLTPLGVLLFGVALLRRRATLAGALSIAAAVAALIAIRCVPHDGLAVPEMLAAVVLSSWTFSMGMRLLIGEPAAAQGS